MAFCHSQFAAPELDSFKMTSQGASASDHQSTISRDGPRKPSFGYAIVHPLGPLFPKLPLDLRRHILYWLKFRRWGRFEHPQLWSEKMQWRILQDRRPILAVASDKLASKRYVRDVAQMSNVMVSLPETLWAGTDVKELYTLRSLLPSRWVLKPNSSSGRVRLIDASQGDLNWDELIESGRRWMLPDEQVTSLGHWGYGVARRMLLAEERIGEGSGPPADLRAHVFNGRVERLDYSVGLGTATHQIASYAHDLSSRMMSNLPHEISEGTRTPIDTLSSTERSVLIHSIEAIAGGIDYLRVDGYFDGGKYWFGELTAYTESGIGPISLELDQLAGRAWTLPDLSVSGKSDCMLWELLEQLELGRVQTAR